MNNELERPAGPLLWLAALLLAAFLTGCGGGGSSGTGAIAPGAVCAAGSVTIPTVTLSDPTNGNQQVTTSTGGVAGGGKSINATFNMAMDAATINANSFTLSGANGAMITPATVAYNASTHVATLTTSAALQTNTVHTATINKGATSAAGTATACVYASSFTTVNLAATGLAPINLGRVASFAAASSSGITNTAAAPTTHINGDLVLTPNDTCNAVSVDNVGGFGLCNGFAPTISGSVITPTYPDTTTATAVMGDLMAAFLSITPSAGPPAAGSLDGATSIPAGTTLGAATGSALVPGDNLFVPGVYRSTTSIFITDDLTLDAQGDTDAVFVFQSSSTIGTSVGARILLVNGAKASNVWWQAGTSATLGTNSAFQGNILASADVTMNLGATSCGRLLAGAFTAGAFVFDSNVVSVPGHPSAPAPCN